MTLKKEKHVKANGNGHRELYKEDTKKQPFGGVE